MKHTLLRTQKAFFLFLFFLLCPVLTTVSQDQASTLVPRKKLPLLTFSREVPSNIFQRRASEISHFQRISLPARSRSGSSIHTIRTRAENLSRMKMPYVFGGSTPADGGLDCSGSIQCLLAPIGYGDIPRTSYAQFDWMKKNSRIRRSRSIEPRDLRSGDLIFWGGTYNSGHKVSHVMFFMGHGTDGKMYMFGARGKGKTGISGAGVDIWELRPGSHKNLIGFSSLPGLSR